MGAEPEWPRFRGPDANPVFAKGRLPEKWSKTETWNGQRDPRARVVIADCERE